MGQINSVKMYYLIGASTYLITHLFTSLLRNKYQNVKKLRLITSKDLLKTKKNNQMFLVSGQIVSKSQTIPAKFTDRNIYINDGDIVVNSPHTNVVNPRKLSVEKFFAPFKFLIDSFLHLGNANYDYYYHSGKLKC